MYGSDELVPLAKRSEALLEVAAGVDGVAAVPYALIIFAAVTFVAAFLNSVFDYCLGCQL